MRQKMLLPIVLCVIIVFNLVGCTADERVDLEDKKDGDVVQTVTNESLETMEYMDKLFDQSVVHEINVEIDEEDWSDLKTNPLIKTKYMVQVTIDGETFQNVSFATKGNTSLSSVASDSDSDRYSFKINFGKYEAEQNYYGLDQLNLNNLYADATYMKDYISYEIFRAVGVDAPLTSYVELKINGESFGLYLAIEEVGDSYLKRTGNEKMVPHLVVDLWEIVPQEQTWYIQMII